MEQELIDVYDANRVSLDKAIPREGAHLAPGEFMLYVIAIVRDKAGRYLITQRSKDKSWGAGWWEVTGGGVRFGETTAEAVVREVDEEVGLDVSGCSLTPIDTYTNVDDSHGSNYIVDIFEFELDFKEEDVTLLECEADDFKLATWDEIEELGNQGVFLHYKRIKSALNR